MASFSLRSAFFGRVFVNMAFLLGLFQVLVWHWWSTVVMRDVGPGWLAVAFAAVALGFLHSRVLPSLWRQRRGAGWLGRLARLYMNLGISTLLLGVALAFLWSIFLVPAGLFGALGGSPELAFGLFRGVSLALAGSVVLLLAWGFTAGSARVARTHTVAHLPGLAPQLAGLRIVQISDLHIGNGLEGPRLRRMVERVNAEDADVVVVTGDIFDFDPRFVEDGVRELAGLRARYGVYAILGNHDFYTGAERVAAAFGRLAPGIRLLRDELVPLPVGAPLYLAGADDPGHDWSARRLKLEALDELAARRPGDGPTLLLVHRPEAFAQAAELGFPLVLAGHTHGGQLAFPAPGGRWNLARIVTPLTRGVYRAGGSTLYVNRGLGMGGPALRINCPREIATLELHPG